MADERYRDEDRVAPDADASEPDAAPDLRDADDSAAPTDEPAAADTLGAGRQIEAEGPVAASGDRSGGPPAVEGSDPNRTLPQHFVNQGVRGKVVLHYPARDVCVALDGAAALRVLEMIRRKRKWGLSDRFDPAESSAFAGWLVFDPREVLAATWVPIFDGDVEGAAVDPVLPEQQAV